MPKIIADITKGMLLAKIPSSKNAKTGRVAPARGIPKKLENMSCIVFGLLKYRIQYSSYKIIDAKMMIKIGFKLNLTPQNSENTVTKISPNLSNVKKSLFSFFEYFS